MGHYVKSVILMHINVGVHITIAGITGTLFFI